jgi:ribonuclease III
MTQTDISQIEKRLLYTFENKEFLHESLRHSSFVNEQADPGLRDNERFEFLGDAVLNLTVGHMLMLRYPDLKEGDLSRMRANLVNESQLASIAQSLDLGSIIQLGKGEIQTKGHEKQSILAGTFEAIIAAVYLDGGFENALKIIEDLFLSLLDSNAMGALSYDYKSQIQELVQLIHQKIPIYKVVQESGPDHDKTFIVQLKVGEIETEGTGKSKKMAEQDAARKGLKILEPNA